MKTSIFITPLLILGYSCCHSYSASIIANCKVVSANGVFIPRKAIVELYNENDLPNFERKYTDKNGMVVFDNLPKGRYTVQCIWMDASKNLIERMRQVEISDSKNIQLSLMSD